MNKPRPDDWAPLAKFYYADEALNDIGNLKIIIFLFRPKVFSPKTRISSQFIYTVLILFRDCAFCASSRII